MMKEIEDGYITDSGGMGMVMFVAGEMFFMGFNHSLRTHHFYSRKYKIGCISPNHDGTTNVELYYQNQRGGFTRECLIRHTSPKDALSPELFEADVMFQQFGI